MAALWNSWRRDDDVMSMSDTEDTSKLTIEYTINSTKLCRYLNLPTLKDPRFKGSGYKACTAYDTTVNKLRAGVIHAGQ